MPAPKLSSTLRDAIMAKKAPNAIYFADRREMVISPDELREVLDLVFAAGVTAGMEWLETDDAKEALRA